MKKPIYNPTIDLETALMLCNWFWEEKKSPTMRKLKEILIVNRSKSHGK